MPRAQTQDLNQPERSEALRIMGVDPGLTRCGVGVVDLQGARRFAYVAAGVIRTPSTSSVDQRLLGIWQGLAQWLDEYQPDVLCVERVFAQHNLHSVMGTAQAAGLAITAAAARGIPVAWHTPSEIKAAVTGSGRAQKQQVQTMVQKLLGLASPPEPPDAADALALAITHILRPTTVEPNQSLEMSCDGKAATAQQQWLAAESAAKRRKAGG